MNELAPIRTFDTKIAAQQSRRADEINTFLDKGGRIEWSRGTRYVREIERAVAVGMSIVIAFTDGEEEICGVWDAMDRGYALRWMPKKTSKMENV